MQIDYVPFVDRMIQRYEGPYGWNKKDPGGPTKYGITCYDLAEHMGQKMDSMARWAPIVQAMTLQVAEAIYSTKYATAVRFNDLPAGVDCTMYDYGVNSGTGRPILAARSILGVKGSGMDATLLAAIQKADPKKFIDDMCAERLRFMHAIRGGSAWAEFGHGWQARVTDLQAYAEHLAAGSTHETAPAAHDLSQIVTPKAINVGKTATNSTAGGVVAAGVTAHQAGLPIWGIALACTGVLAAGIAYEAISAANANAANLRVA